MIRGAAIAGAGAWAAPVIIDSLTSPAAATSCPSPYFVPGGAGALAHTAVAMPTTLTPLLPFTPQANDLILVVASYRGAEAGSPDVSSPGYTVIGSSLVGTTPQLRLRVLYKVATASEADPVVTFNATGSGCAAAVFIYRCVNPAAPFVGSTASGQTLAATTFTAPTHASTPANTRVINVIAGTLSGGATFTSASPWAVRASGGSYGTTDGPQAIGVSDILTTAVGAQTGSSWSTSPTSNNWVGLSLALQL